MLRPGCVAFLLSLAVASSATATSLTVEGLTFSDELGGFKLLDVTGEGSRDNPFVVVEEIDDTGPAILTIYGLDADFGNRVGTQHVTGFAMTKIAINRSGRSWLQYHLELREVNRYSSPYTDGLSFGQGSSARDYVSSAFPSIELTDEPIDALGFSGGWVPEGGKASFSFFVTDASPVARILLLQEAYDPLSDAGCAAPRRCLADMTRSLWR